MCPVLVGYYCAALLFHSDGFLNDSTWVFMIAA